MSASQVIEQIRALSREEQREVAAFLKTLEVESDSAGEETVRYTTPEKARELSGKIFEENAELFRKLAL